MRLEVSTDIARPIAVVFDFVADPRNDVQWCPKVLSVEVVGDPEPRPGARYVVMHRPVPIAPERRMDYRLVRWEPPHEIEWHADDGADTNVITYRFEEKGPEATRFTQADDIKLATPSFMNPFMKLGIRSDIKKQMRRLRKTLEAGAG